MRKFRFLVLLTALMISTAVPGFDIGLVPLHNFNDQQGKDYGQNISLHGSLRQITRMRQWLGRIAEVPKGRQTLVAIRNSGHKLMIFHSSRSIISSGKTSAPLSANLINGLGESIDIYFNFDIPEIGTHLVFDTRRQPIEYTAIQNLYHELAHAMHMMNGTWAYARSERQAIEEENIFREQLARHRGQPFLARYFVSGEPICPDTPELLDESWQQEIICN